MNATELVLRGTLGEVLMRAVAPERYPVQTFEPLAGRAMRWPSGIEGIQDQVALEGFYGFSIVLGRFKLGKSLLAFRSAAETADTGTRVIYVEAELDAMQLTKRMLAYGGADWYPRLRELFIVRMLSAPISMLALAEDIALHLRDAERVLIVLDSVNRIAKRIAAHSRTVRGGRWLDYFSAMELVIDWCAEIRRMAPTQIGVLVTSEENGRGSSKGQQLEYAGDMTLRVKGTAGSELVELLVPFSREGGAGELEGPYRRNWREARFERVRPYESTQPQERML